jgi:hypothetical protein
MTIANEDSRTGPYTGNSTTGSDGTSVFAYDFKILDEAHLVVTSKVVSTGVETVQTITTHYTVSGVGDEGGGNVTMVATFHPLTTETLTISRSVPLTQLTDLQNRGATQPATLETAYDKGVQISQDLKEVQDRAVKFAVSADLTSFNPDVPAPVASKAIAINAAGTGFELVDEPSAAQAAAAASAAAALVSENAAAADLVLTNADVVLTNADVVLTNADVVLTNADVVTAGTSETNAAASAAAAAASAAGIFWKEPVVNATTANITLSGEQTIDAILTSTSRILVKDQSAPAENGVYVTAAGAWARATPLDTWDEHIGAAVIVSSGSVHGDSAWICTVDTGGTLETTAITWAALSQVYTSATTTSEGIIELATNAEVATGSDTSRAVTAAGAAAHYSPIARTITADTGTALNSALTHEGGVVTMSNASANVFTIEPNATIAHSTGAQIDVIQLGAGVTSITGDTGVTLNGVSAGTGAMTAQYGAVTLLRISSDVWTASGAIGTVA